MKYEKEGRYLERDYFTAIDSDFDLNDEYPTLDSERDLQVDMSYAMVAEENIPFDLAETIFDKVYKISVLMENEALETMIPLIKDFVEVSRLAKGEL